MSVQQTNVLRLILVLIVCPIVALFLVPQETPPVMTLYWGAVISIALIAPCGILVGQFSKLLNTGNEDIGRLYRYHYLDNISIQSILGMVFGGLTVIEGWILACMNKLDIFTFIVLNNLLVQCACLVMVIVPVSWLTKISRGDTTERVTCFRD